jgi:hypothetical protein
MLKLPRLSPRQTYKRGERNRLATDSLYHSVVFALHSISEIPSCLGNYFGISAEFVVVVVVVVPGSRQSLA